jgi:hypothetical protein
LSSISCIVEGHGDVVSYKTILRRIAQQMGAYQLHIPDPIRVPRSKLVREGELEKAVELGARIAGPGGGILVVFDADDDPPCRLGPALRERVRKARPDRPTALVLANMEKEAWFIAAAESLGGHRGLPTVLRAPEQPEGIRGAKEWLSARMGRPYSEVADQPAFSGLFDLQLAQERSPSFARLVRESVVLIRAVTMS